MTRRTQSMGLAAMLIACGMTFAGCEKGTFEEAGEEIDEVIEDIDDGIEDSDGDK